MKIKSQPIEFEPFLKTVIWGGEKIKNYKGVSSDLENIGESWEISGLPGHVSVVKNGPYKGKTLNELIDEFGAQLLGEHVLSKYGKVFPLLIKFIDAADNLSVQVHPDDALARLRHNSLGKTEMWYIIHTDKGAKIYAGLKEQLNPMEYKKRVADGTFASALAVYESKPGDVFFLPAGRVHAIGAGNLLAEIQETSDVTYRIYDYDRRDADGKPRKLHTNLAQDAIDYEVKDTYRSEPPADDEKVAKLAECEHFSTKRILVDGELELPLSSKTFHIIIGIDGNVMVEYPEGTKPLKPGMSLLLPTTMSSLKLKGSGKLLITSCLPD